MALSEQEFEELKSLLGVDTQQPKQPVSTQRSAGGGRGSYLTGVTNPLQFIAAQRAAEQQQLLVWVLCWVLSNLKENLI